MAKVSDYVEATESVTPNGGWLFIAELQDDGSYITKKIAPHNVGAVGPAGQQGLQGEPGAAGAQGEQGLQGNQGDPGPAGGSGTNGANSEMTRSSTDSVAVGAGSKTFNYTVAATNLGWAIGTRLRAASAGTPANYVEGLVTAVSNTQVTINSDNFGGAGSSADWNISIAGDKGATGATGASGDPAASELRNSDGLSVEYFDDYSLGSISTFDQGYGWDNDGVGSGTTIVSKTMVSGQVQNRLQIIAGQYGRKMPWGNDWGRIILAFLVRIDNNATFSGNLNYLGVCSGTTNMVASSSTDNFVGLMTGNNANDFTFTNGTRMSYFDHNPAWRFVSRRGTTNTDRTSGSGSAGRMCAATEGYLSLHTLEIGRPTFANSASSITYSFGRLMTDGTQVEMSLAKTVLLDVLRDPVVTTVGTRTQSQVIAGGVLNSTSWSFDESTGELDTINISWSRAFGLEIAALGVRKVW